MLLSVTTFTWSTGVEIGKKITESGVFLGMKIYIKNKRIKLASLPKCEVKWRGGAVSKLSQGNLGVQSHKILNFGVFT